MSRNVRLGIVMWLGLVWLVPFGTVDGLEACTTAVLNGRATLKGVPMLWKNRDTNVLSNKVIFVKETPYSYLALVNADETSGRWVYAGLNETGFGIMNSVAYNLPKKSREMEDLEGLIMADALRTCRTVEDFENYIQKNLGASLGSWANFGVIDGEGAAVLFEIHNHGCETYDTRQAERNYLINSNFSRSGKTGKGAGYLRFYRATDLFARLPRGQVSHRDILITMARDFGHPLLKHPGLKELRQFSGDEPVWIMSRDTINRSITSAAVVIEGRKPGEKGSMACMWVILGEPVCSLALPLWVEAGASPAPLHEGKMAPICRQAGRIKRKIRPYTESDREDYMNVSRLDNKEGKGFLPILLEAEQEIFSAAETFLKRERTPEELARFQERMARQALATLKGIK